MTIRLVLLGRQGSGKGTQGARLAVHYGIAHISTGEMLRNAIKNATPVGKAVKEIIDNGGLVNDELMELARELGGVVSDPYAVRRRRA